MSDTPRTSAIIAQLSHGSTLDGNWYYLRNLAQELERKLAEANAKLAEAKKPQVTVAEFIKDLPEGTCVTNGRLKWRVSVHDKHGTKCLYRVDNAQDFYPNECETCAIPNLQVVEQPKPKKHVADYFVLFPGPIVDTRNGESSIFVKETFEIGSEPEGAVLIPGSERLQ